MDRFGLFMLVAAVAVGATISIVVRIMQLIVERIRGRPFTRSVGWPAALGWALGFAIGALAAAGVMSIGILVLPVALIVCGVVAWRCRAFPEGAIGASLGGGIVMYVVGMMNPTPPPPCPGLPPGTGEIRGVRLKSGAQVVSYSCGTGGVDGTSWLPLAGALVIVGLAGQMMLERRRKDRLVEALPP